MKVLGITGGVGAGKSTVLEYLRERYQVRVILADEVGRVLQQPGQACYAQIVRAFGSGILQEDAAETGVRTGEIDRQKLSAIVFADIDQLSRLNAIVHPAVKAYIIEEIEKEKQQQIVPFVVIEAALLFEDHYDQICDEIWYIHTDKETRMRRLAKSRGYTEQKSCRIMENQMSEEQYREKCNLVIDNSSEFVENTYEQIDEGLIRHGFL
ncbi:MAG: dephospho-CoA kinase [Lachnospiraceae bacterium]|nr:dephospho-CoA kinase [Lachnospiraceae bacterium]